MAHIDATRPARLRDGLVGSRLRASPDALAMLRADHGNVCRLFDRFSGEQTTSSRSQLAGEICQALLLHLLLEEEVFYPAFCAATGDMELDQQAKVEHEPLRRLITQIQDSNAHDDSFVARVKVLAAIARHHFSEEEKRDGMFAEASSAGMDLVALGVKMKAFRVRLRKRLSLLYGC